MANRQIPPALTQTWVFINYADRIRFETTQPVRMMDRDLVLWKSRSGHISLQDAYCPHLGAHLGYGKVRGENLECLFHKRQFNHAGVCLGMGKNLRNYTLTVSNNMIFAWFGETQPTWEIPDLLKSFNEDKAATFKILRTKNLNYNFHPKDLLDNTVDAMHFKTFHNQCYGYKKAEIIESSFYHFISKVVFTGNPQLKLHDEMKLELVTESYGPCSLIVNSTVTILKQIYFFKFIFLCTPLENAMTRYTLAIAVRNNHKTKRSLGKRFIEFFYNHYAFHMQLKEFIKESEQIWQFKTYLASPDYGTHEDVMAEYTNWFKQFYVKEREHINIT